MPDVLITENIIGAEMNTLRANFDCTFEPNLWQQPEVLHAMIGDYKALIVRNQTQVTRELMAAGTNLQIIGRAGVGLDNVDLQAATEHGIVVAFTPEQNANSVAELTIGLMLALARKIPAADRDTKAGGWKRQQFTGIEILGKTLGLVGFGRIGASTANKARALGMDIIAYDPFVDAESLKAMEVRAEMMGLEAVLQRADFVSCHLPATKSTMNFFDDAKFARMKPSAYFINTSRGEVVNEDDLLRALQAGKIAGAALDVRAQEPPAPSPLAKLDNVILLPHIGAFTTEGQMRVVNAVCKDVAAVLKGGTAKNFANFSKPNPKS
ncbi:MAG TPA: hydroxyacid dehydrogenase [Blastocatellia bacterium]|nr:hydroxyacid dehydrogenase [Blastocatellia bacterium]